MPGQQCLPVQGDSRTLGECCSFQALEGHAVCVSQVDGGLD